MLQLPMFMFTGEFEKTGQQSLDKLPVPSELVERISEIISVKTGAWLALRDLMNSNPALSPQIMSIQHMEAYFRNAGSQRTLLEKVSIFRAVSKDRLGSWVNPDDENKLIKIELGSDEPTDQDLLEGILNGRVYVGYLDNDK